MSIQRRRSIKSQELGRRAHQKQDGAEPWEFPFPATHPRFNWKALIGSVVPSDLGDLGVPYVVLILEC